MFHVWLVYRFLTSGRRLLNLPTLMSLVGMTLGVASLTVAMGVVSGFEATLKKAIIDVFGDVMIVRRVERSQSFDSVVERIKKIAPEAQSFTPFVNLEGIITGNGKLAGVLINGLDPKSVDKVLSLRSRVIKGHFALGNKGELPNAMVGKALAKRFDLNVGETFKVVLPTPSRSDSTDFAPKVMTFTLAGVLDLGKAEYDERTIVTDLKAAQTFAGIGENFTGIRIKIDSSSVAAKVASRLGSELGTQYWTMAWSEVDRNLFEAIKIEKTAIFFVILVMVVAASFNISSNLFVSVLKKYADISILRAMGFSGGDVRKVFILQGLFYGIIGTVLGLVLGLLLCFAFEVAQRYVVLMPAETYRLDYVKVDLRVLDLAAIVASALLICLLSTYVPARRGAKLDPVEGLRYE